MTSLLDRFLSTRLAYNWRDLLPSAWAQQSAQAQFDGAHNAYQADGKIGHLYTMRAIMDGEDDTFDTPERRSLLVQLNLLHRAKDSTNRAQDQEWWVGVIQAADSIEDATIRTATGSTLIAMAYNELLPDHETERLARVFAFEPVSVMERMFELKPDSTNWLVFGAKHCPHNHGETIHLMRKQQEAILAAFAAFVRAANRGTGTDVGDSHENAAGMMSRTVVKACGLNPIYLRLAGFQPHPQFLYETAMQMRLYTLASQLATTPEDMAQAHGRAQRLWG